MTLRRYSEWLCEVGLVATAAFVPLSIAGMQISMAVLAAGVLLGLLSGARRIVPAELLWPVGGFVAVCYLASLVSPVTLPLEAWLAPRPVLMLLLVPAGIALAPDRERAVRGAALALLAAGLFVAVLGLAQRGTGFDLNHFLGLRRTPFRVPSPMGDGFSAVGTFNSRLTYGAIQVGVLLLALATALGARTLAVRVAAGAMALPVAAAITATYARAAWLGVGLGAAVLLLGLRRRAALVLALVVSAAAVAGAMVPQVRERAASAVRATANQDRLFIWSRAGEVIADHSVLGVGVYGYPIVAGPYYDRVDPLFPMRTWAHDMPLTLLAETGPAGLLCWIWMLAAASLVAWRGLRRSEGTSRAIRLGALAALAGFVMHGMFHDVLYDGEAAIAMFFFAGLACAPLERTSEEETAPLPKLL